MKFSGSKFAFWAASAVLAALPAVAAWAGARGDSADPALEGLTQIFGTKLTHIDLDGDGRPDLVRSFDTRGRQTRSVRTVIGSPGRVETTEFTYEPRRRILTTVREEPGGKVISTLEEVYGPGESLETRVTSEGDDRYVETFEGSQVKTERYIGSQRVETTLREGLHLTAGSEAMDRYLTCLTSADDTNERAACQAFLSAPPLSLSSLSLDQFNQFTCRVGSEIHTPTGYRIDAASCTDTASVEALQRVARQVTTTKLACLNTINPQFAEKFARTLRDRAPMLRCTSRMDPATLAGEACGTAATGASCRSGMPLLIRRTGGYQTERSPNSIYMTGDDPSLAANRPLPNAAFEARAVTTLFHETLHACGHPGGPNHNHPHFGDDVYGCQALCGGSELAWQITREGCAACLNAERSGQGETATRLCARFPRAAPMQKLWAAEDAGNTLSTCATNGAACDDRLEVLAAGGAFTGVCPARPSGNTVEWRATCIQRVRVRMGALIREAFSTAGDAEEQNKVFDAFKGVGASGSGVAPQRGSGGLEFPEDPSLSSEARASLEARQGSRAVMLGFLVNNAFCAEIGSDEHPNSAMTPARYRELRAQYEDLVPVRIPGYRIGGGGIDVLVLRPENHRNVTTPGHYENAEAARRSPFCTSNPHTLWQTYGRNVTRRGGGG